MEDGLSIGCFSELFVLDIFFGDVVFGLYWFIFKFGCFMNFGGKL